MKKYLAIVLMTAITLIISFSLSAKADSSRNISSNVGITFLDDGNETQKIIFDANGGETQQKTIVSTVGETVELSGVSGAVRDGYSFKGWYTTKTGNGRMPRHVKLGSQQVTYYAQWSKGNMPKTGERAQLGLVFSGLIVMGLAILLNIKRKIRK